MAVGEQRNRTAPLPQSVLPPIVHGNTALGHTVAAGQLATPSLGLALMACNRCNLGQMIWVFPDAPLISQLLVPVLPMLLSLHLSVVLQDFCVICQG